MADAIWKEYELFCPVCNATFKQLVVLHKVPKNFDITPYLDGFVKSHDHKTWQEARRQKAESGGSQDAPEA
jgi:5-methylcytosine-specific restriction endonuclease McrA